LQLVPHAPPAHANGVQGCVSPAPHVPPPHLPASVSVPALHDPVEHVVSAPGNPAHFDRVFPSHVSLPQIGCDGSAPHFARVPCGSPTTAVHAPSDVPMSHASQMPPHAESQHTPSTQWLAASPPSAHSSSEPHGLLSAMRGEHVPPAQYALGAQSALVTHVEGQSIAVPSHAYGAHEGRPALPFVAVTHVPRALAEAHV
jgi:hypothetical protein